MYKFYRIWLQIKYPECADCIEIIRRARSYKEACYLATWAAEKYDRMASEDGGRVYIARVDENTQI